MGAYQCGRSYFIALGNNEFCVLSVLSRWGLARAIKAATPNARGPWVIRSKPFMTSSYGMICFRGLVSGRRELGYCEVLLALRQPKNDLRAIQDRGCHILFRTSYLLRASDRRLLSAASCCPPGEIGTEPFGETFSSRGRRTEILVPKCLSRHKSMRRTTGRRMN